MGVDTEAGHEVTKIGGACPGASCLNDVGSAVAGF